MPRKNKYATPKERRKACRDGALKRWAGLKTPEERRAATAAATAASPMTKPKKS
jgi:hypothetical protein